MGIPGEVGRWESKGESKENVNVGKKVVPSQEESSAPITEVYQVARKSTMKKPAAFKPIIPID